MIRTLTVGTAIQRVADVILGPGGTFDAAYKATVRFWLDAALAETLGGEPMIALRRTATVTTQQGVDIYPLPFDFRELLASTFRFRDNQFYDYKIDFLSEDEYQSRVRGSYTLDTDIPRYVSLVEQSPFSGSVRMRFIPVPDQAYEIDYQYRSVALNIRDAADDDIIDVRMPEDLQHLIIVKTLLAPPLIARILPQEQAAFIRQKMDLEAKLAERATPVGGAHMVRQRFRSRRRTSNTLPYTIDGSTLPITPP